MEPSSVPGSREPPRTKREHMRTSSTLLQLKILNSRLDFETRKSKEAASGSTRLLEQRGAKQMLGLL